MQDLLDFDDNLKIPFVNSPRINLKKEISNKMENSEMLKSNFKEINMKTSRMRKNKNPVNFEFLDVNYNNNENSEIGSSMSYEYNNSISKISRIFNEGMSTILDKITKNNNVIIPLSK